MLLPGVYRECGMLAELAGAYKYNNGMKISIMVIKRIFYIRKKYIHEGGRMTRKLIAVGLKLMLPLSLLGLSGCESLQAVDSGLYKMVDVVSEQDRVTGQRSLSFAGRASQIRQGNTAVEQLLQAEAQVGRKLNAQLDAAQYARLARLFDRVQRISHLKSERWQPVLIDRAEFNAFTTGGTYIVVHLGLMQQLSDDDELAAHFLNIDCAAVVVTHKHVHGCCATVIFRLPVRRYTNTF